MSFRPVLRKAVRQSVRVSFLTDSVCVRVGVKTRASQLFLLHGGIIQHQELVNQGKSCVLVTHAWKRSMISGGKIPRYITFLRITLPRLVPGREGLRMLSGL